MARTATRPRGAAPEQLTIPTGQELANQGADAVYEHAGGWAEVVRHAIRVVAAQMETFTMEDIREKVQSWDLPKPKHPNAWGAVMRRASLDGEIVQTGSYKPSENPKARGRTVAEWRAA